ncbi:MAG: ATP-binding protein, partial [Myxococcaceae bacterium]
TKRWQDVYELVDSGIDVYSTLNVQHLDSRKESVEQIAQITVHETVPDSVLDRAFQIRLIDLSPSELLKRLKEGKVYLGDKALLASKNFFQEEKLTALREIALRLAAEKVDTDLQNFTASRGAGAPWQAVERLMVAVDHRRQTQDIIRSTRRLAFNLEGPWLAVHIDAGRLLSQKDQMQLVSNLEFARSLGAEVMTVSDTHVASALVRIAKQRNVTQIVIGKSKKRWFRSTLHELVYEQDDVDILVQGHQVVQSEKNSFLQGLLERQALVTDYVRNLGVLSVLTLPVIFFHSEWIYLVGLAWLCLSSSIGPLMLGAFFASLSAHYLEFEQAIWSSVCYFALAFVGGLLNSRIKLNQALLNSREERSNMLYEVIRDILAISNREEMLKAVEARVGHFLKGECSVCLKKRDNLGKLSLADSELGVAKWVFENQKPAGWSTDTISGAKALYLPLQGPSETLGVLIFKPKEHESSLSEPDRSMLHTISKQLALSLEKELFRERAQETDRLQEASQVHKSILSFMADELRSPLSVIVQAVTIMLDKDDEMVSHLLNATEKLGIVIDNLLTISRLSVGIFPIKRVICTPNKLVQSALNQLKRTLSEHTIQVEADPELASLSVDMPLCEQAIANILINAAQYTPESVPIKITLKQLENEIHIGILDGGPGVPEAYLSRIFDKFYRYPGSKGQGAGIGLAVAKGVIRAHEGKITVSNIPDQGACFTVILPVASSKSL